MTEEEQDYIIGYNKDNEPSVIIFLTEEGKKAVADKRSLANDDGTINLEYVSGFGDYKALMRAEF